MIRLIIIICLFLSSCNYKIADKEVATKTNIQLTHLDSLLVDTPKILKGGKDYWLTATSKYDAKYFGKKFAPYKLEPYNVAQIERMLDSLIKQEQQSVSLKEKSIIDFKYVFYAAVTRNKNLEARIVGFDRAKLKCWGFTDNRQENCTFSIIYDLIKNRILVFQAIGK